MKVNFKQTLRQLQNPDKPLLDGLEPQPGEEDQRQPLLLSAVAMNALMGSDPNEKVSGEEKVKRYELALRIREDDGDYSVEDIALIKKLIGEGYTALVVGQAYKMLEGEKVVGSVLAK